MKEGKIEISDKKFQVFYTKQKETQRRDGRTPTVFSVAVHKAAYARHLKSSKHLKIEKSFPITF